MADVDVRGDSIKISGIEADDVVLDTVTKLCLLRTSGQSHSLVEVYRPWLPKSHVVTHLVPEWVFAYHHRQLYRFPEFGRSADELGLHPPLRPIGEHSIHVWVVRVLVLEEPAVVVIPKVFIWGDEGEMLMGVDAVMLSYGDKLGLYLVESCKNLFVHRNSGDGPVFGLVHLNDGDVFCRTVEMIEADLLDEVV